MFRFRILRDLSSYPAESTVFVLRWLQARFLSMDGSSETHAYRILCFPVSRLWMSCFRRCRMLCLVSRLSSLTFVFCPFFHSPAFSTLCLTPSPSLLLICGTLSDIQQKESRWNGKSKGNRGRTGVPLECAMPLWR